MASGSTTTDNAIKIKYSIPRVLKIRDKLASSAFIQSYGAIPKGKDFEGLIAKVVKDLPGVDYDTIFDSIHGLAGQRLTTQLIFNTCWRLAGNLPQLRCGVSVPPWTTQDCKEWVPIQVTSHQFGTTPFGKAGGRFRMRVLAGSPCPLFITTFWNTSACIMIARRAGYTAVWHDYPFSHNSELVNMRLLVLIDPERCMPGRPWFFEVDCPDSLKKWNRRVIQRRFRRSGNKVWKCPRGHNCRCYECHIGYTECPAATHRETTDQICPTIGRNEQ